MEYTLGQEEKTRGNDEGGWLFWMGWDGGKAGMVGVVGCEMLCGRLDLSGRDGSGLRF